MAWVVAERMGEAWMDREWVGEAWFYLYEFLDALFLTGILFVVKLIYEEKHDWNFYFLYFAVIWLILNLFSIYMA